MCTGDYPSWYKNIDSAVERSPAPPATTYGRTRTRDDGDVCALVVAIVQYSHTSRPTGQPASQPASQRGYRFDSSHSSKSNKKLIESVTPPDFTNEISKYQFHVTLFVLAYLAVAWLAGWLADWLAG